MVDLTTIDFETLDFDTMTEAEAEAILNELWQENPERFEAIESVTLIASPLAGPIRILREMVDRPW